MPQRSVSGRVSVRVSPTGYRHGFWENGRALGYYWAGPADDISPFDIHPFDDGGVAEADDDYLVRGHIKFALDRGEGVHAGTSVLGSRDGLLRVYEWVRRQVWEWNVKLAARGHIPRERMMLKEEDIRLGPYVRWVGKAVGVLLGIGGIAASIATSIT